MPPVALPLEAKVLAYLKTQATAVEMGDVVLAMDEPKRDVVKALVQLDMRNDAASWEKGDRTYWRATRPHIPLRLDEVQQMNPALFREVRTALERHLDSVHRVYRRREAERFVAALAQFEGAPRATVWQREGTGDVRVYFFPAIGHLSFTPEIQRFFRGKQTFVESAMFPNQRRAFKNALSVFEAGTEDAQLARDREIDLASAAFLATRGLQP